jgi:1-deoxy-D-xylulose-5-phosphate reductoisomerase
MGKKISIDSATMMNKVFEIIEAQRIFKIEKSKFKILIHPKSYIHSLIKFNSGLIKIVAHDTSMKIPIFNSIYLNDNKKLKTKKINYKILNNLNLSKPDQKKFPSLKLLRKIKNKVSLFETIMISANDELVDLYLNRNIKFNDIFTYLKKILNSKFFKRYLYKNPTNVDQIIKLNKQVRLKTINLCIK